MNDTCVCQITLSISNHKSINELEHDYKNARVYQLSSKLIYGHRIIDARNVMNQWECLTTYIVTLINNIYQHLLTSY